MKTIRYTFRASWEITDESMHLSELAAEATPRLAEMVRRAGAVLLSHPTWRIVGGYLTAEAPAGPLAARPTAGWGSISAHVDAVRYLASYERRTDAQIADILSAAGISCSESGVAKARVRAKPPIAAGVGNPTLAGSVTP